MSTAPCRAASSPALGSPRRAIFCREARAELLCIGGVYVTAEDMDPQVEGRSLEARLDGEELKLRVLD